jgi:hypothetical protein
MILTKAQVKTLKTADAIHFNQNALIAVVLPDAGSIWEPLRATIAVDVTGYDFSTGESIDVLTASGVLESNHVKSIFATLKTGDDVSLHFKMGAAATPALVKAGFFADTLALVVRRGDDTMTFDLCTDVVTSARSRIATKTAPRVTTTEDATTTEAAPEAAAA